MSFVAEAAATAWRLASEAPISPTPATTGNGVIDQWLPFLNFGLIGVLIIMVLTKTGFVPKWTLDKAEEKNASDVADIRSAHEREIALLKEQIAVLLADKSSLKQVNDELTKVAQEQFLPALIESNRLTALYVETLARRGGRGQ